MRRHITLSDLGRWSKHFLLRNPFYILSATLLLLSMRLLSGDARIFTRETPQLLFNFSSFQFYELLLAGTAVLLARRRIWYDAGLLVGIETMFVCVPFILISQALLLENNAVLAFCLAGCALAALRTYGLKRGLTSANMPPALLWIGALVLALNFAFPIVTRLLHEHLSLPKWDDRGAILSAWEWNCLFPLLVGLALLLPSSNHDGQSAAPIVDAFFARRSFPLLVLFLWLSGTAAHLYCIGYVFGLSWKETLLIPTIWAGAWMCWARRADFNFFANRWQAAIGTTLLAGPMAAALLAAWMEDWKRCCVLSFLNAAVYGIIAVKRHDRRALHLGGMSFLVALGSLPHYWLRPAGIHFEHTDALGLCLLVYLVSLTIFSRRAIWGLVGGAGLTAAFIAAQSHTGTDAHLAIQLGAVFVLLHSSRWEDSGHPRSQLFRKCMAIGWLFHSVVWMCDDYSTARAGTFLLGLTVVAVYFCARGVFGQWGPRIIPYTALAVAALDPFCVVASNISEMPTGVVLLIESFGLFGLGTVAALTKHRWHRTEMPPIPPRVEPG